MSIYSVKLHIHKVVRSSFSSRFECFANIKICIYFPRNAEYQLQKNQRIIEKYIPDGIFLLWPALLYTAFNENGLCLASNTGWNDKTLDLLFGLFQPPNCYLTLYGRRAPLLMGFVIRYTDIQYVTHQTKGLGFCYPVQCKEKVLYLNFWDFFPRYIKTVYM